MQKNVFFFKSLHKNYSKMVRVRKPKFFPLSSFHSLTPGNIVSEAIPNIGPPAPQIRCFLAPRPPWGAGGPMLGMASETMFPGVKE